MTTTVLSSWSFRVYRPFSEENELHSYVLRSIQGRSRKMAALAILVFAVVVFGHILRNYIFLNSVPGPLLAGLSGLWREYLLYLPGYSHRLELLHRKYGQVIRIGPKIVSVSDPSAICWIDSPSRRRLEASFDSDTDVGIGVLVGTWPQSSVPVYSTGRVDQTHIDYALEHDDYIEELILSFLRAIRKQRILSLTVFQLLATDMVQGMFLDDPIHKDINEAAFVGDCFIYTDKSYISSFIDYLLLKSPIASLKRKRDSCLSMCELIPEPLKEHVALHTETRNDRSQHASAIAAGAECMVATFAAVLALLLEHLTVMSRLRQEIDVAFSSASLSDILRQTKSCTLPYLDAVMKETMRHVMVSDYKIEAPQEGATIGRYYLPEGTVIQCNADILRRNPTIYGEDSLLFRPERWLLGLEQRKRMEEALIPFQICIGTCAKARGIWLQMKKAIALVIWKFNLQPLYEDEESSYNASPSTVSFNIPVRFIPRLP